MSDQIAKRRGKGASYLLALYCSVELMRCS
jgi:hypothetical protein